MSPAPEVTYNVTRDNGTTVTVIGEALSELTDGDTVVPVEAPPQTNKHVG